MAKQAAPEGVILECLWDKEGIYAIKEDDWKCKDCNSWNDNYEKVDGEKEQLYKCATCDQTRPGFTDIRKQKEAEAAAKKPASLFAGGAISFGGEETTASDDAAASAGDLFGLGGGGAKAPASAPGLDLFGTGASSPAPAAGGLDLFGTASATTSAPALNLFGTPAPAPAAAEGSNSRKRKASDSAQVNKSRRLSASDSAAGSSTSGADVQFIRLSDRPTPLPTGTVFTFGSNEIDQLGLGVIAEDDEDDLELYNSEVMNPRENPYTKDLNLVYIACGGLHNLALDKDGHVYSWGCKDDNSLGRRCDKSLESLTAFYAKVDPAKEKAAIERIYTKFKLSNRLDDLWAKIGKKYKAFPNFDAVPGIVDEIKEPCIQVDCGDCHSVALTKSGRVLMWGGYKDAAGQLGFDFNGKRTQELPREVPKLFDTFGAVVQIASGSNHTLALTAKGKVLAWGDSQQGQIARKVPSRLKVQSLRPHEVKFPRGTKITSVFCSVFSAFAIAEGGKAFAWGLNNFGQLGNGNKENQYSVGNLAIPNEEIIQITGGMHFTLVLTRSGRVYGMGACQSGQIGCPKAEHIKAGFTAPKLVTALLGHTVVEISSGSEFNLCRTSEGRVFAWGSNQMSQLGLGEDYKDDDEVYTPVEIPKKAFGKDATVLQVTTGTMHSNVLVAPK